MDALHDGYAPQAEHMPLPCFTGAQVLNEKSVPAAVLVNVVFFIGV